MAIELSYSGNSTCPIEVEGIVPNCLREMSIHEIMSLPIFHGREKAELGDFFQARGSAEDSTIHWHGALNNVHWIGAGMDGGHMVIHGDCGRHVGSEMSHGCIEVKGSVGDWAGAELHGGTLQVHGHAGHLVGAAYRGSARGMTGGRVLIHGQAGDEIGHSMRRGTIVVDEAGDLAGFNMLAGTLMVCGRSGVRHGAGMRRGTLIFADDQPTPLPSFRYAAPFKPPFLPLLLTSLHQAGFPVKDEWKSARWDLFHGDLIEGGRGEMLVRRQD